MSNHTEVVKWLRSKGDFPMGDCFAAAGILLEATPLNEVIQREVFGIKDASQLDRLKLIEEAAEECQQKLSRVLGFGGITMIVGAFSAP